MKILLTSITVDVFLAVIRANVTVEREGVEESFSFFYPFDQNAKPTASELEIIGDISKTKAFKQHFTLIDLPTKPMEQLYVEDVTTGDMGAVSEVAASPVLEPKRTRSKKPVAEKGPQVAPSTPPAPETIPSEPVEPTPISAPVETVHSEPVVNEHPAPVVVSEGCFTIFIKGNKEHAGIIAGWFREADPEWTKSPEKITLCRQIAADMDGKPFLMGDELKTPCSDIKALAIKSVLEGKSCF